VAKVYKVLRRIFSRTHVFVMLVSELGGACLTIALIEVEKLVTRMAIRS